MTSGADAGAREPTAQDRTVRLPVAVLVVLATVVVALLAVWGTTALSADRLPTGPPRDPPPAPAPATLFAVDGARVQLQEFRATLAGSPFTCGRVADPPVAGFAALAACNHTVHADFDKAGSDWVATNGYALLDDSLVRPDLDATAEATFRAIYSFGYSTEDTARVTGVKRGEFEVRAPAGSYASYSADVRLSKKGLATPYDRIVVIVMKLASGLHVAFFSDFPHDGDSAALDAVAASKATISVRV